MTIEARFNLDRGDFCLDAEFKVPARGVTALFGPSGAGKTTLLRALAGLDRIPGGRLQVGKTFWQRRRRFSPAHRRPIGYVFQEPSLFTHLDVRGNLEYGRKRVKPAQRRISLEQAIDWLRIAPLLGRETASLSGGERQRVAIARALAVSPRLLLMDEPLAALDRASKREILACLDTLHRELDIPVIYVSHQADEISQLADHIILIEAGRVLGHGPIAEVMTRLDLPLAHGPDSAAVVETEVSRHDGHWNLSVLSFGGGRFLVPEPELPIGMPMRVRVEARDVSISLQEPVETSILNIIPATVDSVTDEDGIQVTIRLLAGEVPLLARITRKSAQSLYLAPGRKVYAQVKSVALLR